MTPSETTKKEALIILVVTAVMAAKIALMIYMLHTWRTKGELDE